MDIRYTTPIILAAPGTADATVSGVKTVTRRLARPNSPCRWKTGRRARVYRQHPRTGAAPFGEVEIVSTRLEKLGDITDDDVAREGFPGRDRDWFIANFRSIHKTDLPLDQPVWRIEYRWIERL